MPNIMSRFVDADDEDYSDEEPIELPMSNRKHAPTSLSIRKSKSNTSKMAGFGDGDRHVVCVTTNRLIPTIVMYKVDQHRVDNLLGKYSQTDHNQINNPLEESKMKDATSFMLSSQHHPIHNTRTHRFINGTGHTHMPCVTTKLQQKLLIF